jgi:hypothetical protein
MESPTELILEPMLQTAVQRRQLLPWWIKTFCFIFMLFGPIALLGFIAGAFGVRFDLALFGFETTEPLSPTGLLISSQFILKGVVAYALWNEKTWGIKLALADAYLSIGICTFSMVGLHYFGYPFSVRLELVILVPYVLKLMKIMPRWLGSPEGAPAHKERTTLIL